MLEIAKREPVRTSVTGANITGVFHPGAVGAYFFCRSAWVVCAGDRVRGGSAVLGSSEGAACYILRCVPCVRLRDELRNSVCGLRW